MLQTIKNQLNTVVSGVAAKQMVADISRYHRIQASPEYHQAAEMICETLSAWGLEAQICSYPANESTRFWGANMFQEWNGVAGTLRLIAPTDQACILADFRDVRLSLIPRSAPFEGEVEVAIPRNKGEEPEDYEGLDVAGKMVITDGEVMRVHKLAIEDRGAVGIVFDGMRTLEPVSRKWDLPDAIQSTSFWWWNVPRRGFGFALTPRLGHWLRRLVQETSNDEPVRLHARVESQLYNGTIENVTATIPGKTKDEILIVSHLCHPTPCANDNASGAAAAMEVAHALRSLIDGGGLAPPQRTIRFLWVPEMTGSYAYLASQPREARAHMIAGLNLDMVGEDQDQCGSVMIIDTPPDASASFAIDLIERVRDELFGQKKPFSQRGRYSLFRSATVPFSGLSDHYIFCDPTIGVPMPSLAHWPDRFHHTTADTLDKVSTQTLARSCLLAATYTYWLATAGPSQVKWLAREMTARFKHRTITRLHDASTARMSQNGNTGNEQVGPSWPQLLDYWIERQQTAYESLRRLQADFDPRPWMRNARDFAVREWAAAQDLLENGTDDEKPPETARPLGSLEQARRVPTRSFPGPESIQSLLRFHSTEISERLRQLEKAHKELPLILPTLALYWADGRRDLATIVDQVECETGIRAPEYIAGYFEILAELGVIEQ